MSSRLAGKRLRATRRDFGVPAAAAIGLGRMKRFFAAVPAVLVAVSPAIAADMRIVPAPGPYAVPPPPAWNGAYVGVNAGYQLGKFGNLVHKHNGILYG